MYKDEIRKKKKQLEKLEQAHNDTSSYIKRYTLKQQMVKLRNEIEYLQKKMLR